MKFYPMLKYLSWLMVFLALQTGMVMAEGHPYAQQGTIQQLRPDGSTLIVAIKGMTGEAQYQSFLLAVTPPVVIHAVGGAKADASLLQPKTEIGFNTGLFARPGVAWVTEIWVLTPPTSLPH